MENRTTNDSIFQFFRASFGVGGVVVSCSPAEESATKQLWLLSGCI